MAATNRIQEEEFSGLVLTYLVNDTQLCVPVEHVESIIEPPAITGMPNAPDYVIGAFMHRGQTALALSLRKLLRLPPAGKKNKKESLLVIWMGDQPVGYWVDEVKGMMDSNRGHWSAVPALIRDQGITKALVCDGQVYFPLDLTHSRQFKEISRALQAFEKSNLQSVAEEVLEEVIEPPQLEQGTHQQPAQHKFDTPEESLLAEPDAGLIEEQTVTDNALSDAPEVESFEEQADPSDGLVAAAQDLPLEPELPAETPGNEPATTAEDDDYTVADYPADNTLEEDYAEQIEAQFLAEHGIDTSALARAMHAAQSGVAEVIPLHKIPEVEFDANGQGDAFYELIAGAEAKYGPVEAVEDSSDEMSPLQYAAEAQVDAFDEDYQAVLAQDALDAVIDIEPEEQIDNTASEGISGVYPPGELSLTEEPYSFLPTRLPEDDEPVEPVLLDEPINDSPVDENAIEVMNKTQLAELRQAAIDAAFSEEGDVTNEDEFAADEAISDGLSLTEEPYSFLPTSLPEDNELDEPALLDESIDDAMAHQISADSIDEAQLLDPGQTGIETESTDAEEVFDESIYDEPTLDDLSLTEEADSFLPGSLPEDETGDVIIETEELPAQQDQPLALLPHLGNEASDKLEHDDGDHLSIETGTVSEANERPVIALHYVGDVGDKGDKATSLPDYGGVVSRADFYTDKIADLLKEPGAEVKHDDNISKNIEIEDQALPLEDKAEAPATADVYELKIPQVSPEEVTPAPSLGNKYVMPQLDPAGIIIRPDGQINKNFGLVKLFTIILATSAVGSWWFRDDLFYKEQVRKEFPTILQNEIAFLYSDRVTIVTPKKGVERMIVDTPEQEIKIIRKEHVSRALWRESRIKGVKIHRVRKGDTLWAIASRYLEDPYRYPELAENNRIHNSDLIRPGDVVKITAKNSDTDE